MDICAITKELGATASQANVNVYTSLPGAAPDFPCIVINPPESIVYAETFGGTCFITLPITVYTKSSNWDSAWQLLYALLSYRVPDPAPVSLIDALIDNSTYHNYQSINVGEATNFTLYQDYTIAADLTVTIKTF